VQVPSQVPKRVAQRFRIIVKIEEIMRNVILVTGGAGFIGANFIHNILSNWPPVTVINLDALTYAGSKASLATLDGSENHIFVQGDIGDKVVLEGLLRKYRPSAIINFAAETHVDRSIDSPERFIQTNIVGTFNLLETTLSYWRELEKDAGDRFRFLHVSTDEVFGSLGATGSFTEQTRYAPNSPYAASKASSDHLVRAYFQTYGLPTLTINTCNNYGPYQHPEKLIPLTILNAVEGRPLPIYGDGSNIRDWLYVEDHCHAIPAVLEGSPPGEMYNVGSRNEKSNLEVVSTICSQLERIVPAKNNPVLAKSGIREYSDLISFIEDRPGHDWRYAIDPGKIEERLGWKASVTFENGLRKTINWYLNNGEWCDTVRGKAYQEWIHRNYEYRLGSRI
jgi:dTDP-glucose 4,6-dehydratase